MYYLIFSSNSSSIFFSIYKDKKLLLTNVYIQSKNTSEDIFDIIKNMFSELSLSFKSLSFIGLTNGPSSFTSSRVLVALANSIALSLNIPAIGFSNFYFYLNLVKNSNINFKTLGITIDSKRKNGLYLCLFSNLDVDSDDKKGFFCSEGELLKISSREKDIIFYGDKPIISLDEFFYNNFSYIDNITHNNDILADLCYKKYNILESKNQKDKMLFSNVYYI